MRSKEQDKTKGLALLKRDLINSPYHCFGHHSNYSPDFCQAARSTYAEPAENEENIAQSTNDDDCIYGKSSVFILHTCTCTHMRDSLLMNNRYPVHIHDIDI